MTDQKKQPWALAFIKSDAEPRVLKRLEKIGLRAYAPQVFSEVSITRHFSRAKRAGELEYAFPGYIFIRFPKPEQRGLIRDVEECHRLVKGATSKSISFTDDEIQAIWLAEQSGNLGYFVQVKESKFEIGSIARINDGPFAGFTGEIDNKTEKQFRVLAEIFGRMTPVWLEPGQLDLAS